MVHFLLGQEKCKLVLARELVQVTYRLTSFEVLKRGTANCSANWASCGACMRGMKPMLETGQLRAYWKKLLQ